MKRLFISIGLLLLTLALLPLSVVVEALQSTLMAIMSAKGDSLLVFLLFLLDIIILRGGLELLDDYDGFNGILVCMLFLFI